VTLRPTVLHVKPQGRDEAHESKDQRRYREPERHVRAVAVASCVPVRQRLEKALIALTCLYQRPDAWTYDYNDQEAVLVIGKPVRVSWL
jgi:hypothetical protein